MGSETVRASVDIILSRGPGIQLRTGHKKGSKASLQNLVLEGSPMGHHQAKQSLLGACDTSPNALSKLLPDASTASSRKTSAVQSCVH